MDEKLILQKPRINYADLIYPVILTGLAIFAPFYSTILIVAAVIGWLYFIYRFRKHSNDGKPKIILSKNGIDFCDEKISIPWEQITYIYIESKTKGRGKHMQSVPYLNVKFNNKSISKNLHDYHFSFKKLERIIENYWGREIGTEKEKRDKEAIKQLRPSLDSKKIIEIIKVYKKKQIATVLLVFVAMTSAMIFLQIKSSFPYFIAIGVLVTVVSMWFTIQTQEKNLRKKDIINKLTEKEFKSLLIKYELKTENQKENVKSSFIGFIVFSLIIAIISYLITK